MPSLRSFPVCRDGLFSFASHGLTSPVSSFFSFVWNRDLRSHCPLRQDWNWRSRFLPHEHRLRFAPPSLFPFSSWKHDLGCPSSPYFRPFFQEELSGGSYLPCLLRPPAFASSSFPNSPLVVQRVFFFSRSLRYRLTPPLFSSASSGLVRKSCFCGRGRHLPVACRAPPFFRDHVFRARSRLPFPPLTGPAVPRDFPCEYQGWTATSVRFLHSAQDCHVPCLSVESQGPFPSSLVSWEVFLETFPRRC